MSGIIFTHIIDIANAGRAAIDSEVTSRADPQMQPLATKVSLAYMLGEVAADLALRLGEPVEKLISDIADGALAAAGDAEDRREHRGSGSLQ